MTNERSFLSGLDVCKFIGETSKVMGTPTQTEDHQHDTKSEILMPNFIHPAPPQSAQRRWNLLMIGPVRAQPESLRFISNLTTAKEMYIKTN